MDNLEDITYQNHHYAFFQARTVLGLLQQHGLNSVEAMLL